MVPRLQPAVGVVDAAFDLLGAARKPQFSDRYDCCSTKSLGMAVIIKSWDVPVLTGTDCRTIVGICINRGAIK